MIHEFIRQQSLPLTGEMRFTRWEMASLPEALNSYVCEVVPKTGFFEYTRSAPEVWNMNFADPRLFAAYGSSLMAQDEWQVLEHPILGSLRESLLHTGLPALTRENGVSTPVLISQVPRQCSLDLSGAPVISAHSGWWKKLFGKVTGPTAPSPLYGNAFRKASKKQVLEATKVLTPPSISNILAMAAPTGSGAYRLQQLTDILQTAYSGFKAATIESEKRGAEQGHVEIHTGWWGCGAFGGNRVVMVMLQILAARLAQIRRLHFYIVQEADRFYLDEGISFLDSLLTNKNNSLPELLLAIESLGFSWGKSDGN